MIDIHTHILPHVDDGAESWSDSLTMAQMALRSGVETLVATPHCGMPGQDVEGAKELLMQQYARLQESLTQAEVPLNVCMGMEIFGTEDTARLLERGRLITLNQTRYPLIEFPFTQYARQATAILEEVLSLGYRPVVAHPERYLYVQTDPTLLNVWADMGCLLQVNRGSLLGRFGRTAEELSWAMVERGFVFAVASDAHSPDVRTTWMKDVRDLLENEYSVQAARLLLRERPAQLLRDKEIVMPEPNWFG